MFICTRFQNREFVFKYWSSSCLMFVERWCRWHCSITALFRDLESVFNISQQNLENIWVGIRTVWVTQRSSWIGEQTIKSSGGDGKKGRNLRHVLAAFLAAANLTLEGVHSTPLPRPQLEERLESSPEWSSSFPCQLRIYLEFLDNSSLACWHWPHTLDSTSLCVTWPVNSKTMSQCLGRGGNSPAENWTIE